MEIPLYPGHDQDFSQEMEDIFRHYQQAVVEGNRGAAKAFKKRSQQKKKRGEKGPTLSR